MAYFIFRFTDADVFFETLKSGTGQRLSVKMDKLWHHGIIKYLQKEGLAPKKIHANMVATLGDDTPALSTVKKGRESLEDDPRSGRSASATTQENINHVHHMVINDRYFKALIAIWSLP